MNLGIERGIRSVVFSMLGAVALIGSATASAQIQQVDPDRAIDGDLATSTAAPQTQPSAAPSTAPVDATASTAPVAEATPVATSPAPGAPVAVNSAKREQSYYGARRKEG